VHRRVVDTLRRGETAAVSMMMTMMMTSNYLIPKSAPGTALVGVAVSWRRSARHDKRDSLAMFITPPLLPVSLTVPTIEVWGEVGAPCASEKRTLRRVQRRTDLRMVP